MYESTTEKFMHTLIGYRVPIYSIASWCSIISLKVAMFVDPIRDVYEVIRTIFPSSLDKANKVRHSRSTHFSNS
jgi:hypothetical protein